MEKYLAAAKVGTILKSFAPNEEAIRIVIKLYNNALMTTEDQCLRIMCRTLSDGVIFGKWPWMKNTTYTCPDMNCGWCGEAGICMYPLCPRNAQHVDTTQFIGR